MFTGLIEERGEVIAIERAENSARITVRGPLVVSDSQHGASISVSGVCLTVVDRGPDWFSADVMGQTLAMSAIGGYVAGRAVNLERAALVGDRIHVAGGGPVMGGMIQTAYHEAFTLGA